MSKYSSLLAAFVFLALALACKLKAIDLAANFALFGALSIFCGAYLRGVAAWAIPLFGIALSDFLGNFLKIPGVHNYDFQSMMLNYAGFAAMVGVGHLLRYRDSTEYVLGSAFLGSILFFVISNFGCWLDPIMKYDRSASGLLNCYVMAIPFFKYTILSDVIFTLLFVFTHRTALSLKAEHSNVPTDR